jgi:ABC-type transporter Mla maintaining outer membrane lipid asymmetry ATPase subunit MlaF
VFLVTHDLDTLYTITDRVAVLSQKKVLVADAIDVVSKPTTPGFTNTSTARVAARR